MEIIKLGHSKPLEKYYYVTCNHCDTELKYWKRDIEWDISTMPNTCFITCLNCKSRIHVPRSQAEE